MASLFLISYFQDYQESSLYTGAALNYMIGRNNIYVSVSRGRRPGVLYFNNDPEDFETLSPEIIYSYEAGVKGCVLGGKLNYDFFFHMDSCVFGFFFVSSPRNII